ncbi:MAG: GNAT family N-acetyltransferase, partial [Akkermansia sp.]
PPLEQTIEQLLEEEQNSVFFKYTENGHIIGSVRGSLDASGTCHVGRLIVAPYCRNRGIGRQLMEALEEYFRGKASRYLLFTSEETPETLHLYGKLGYEKLYTRNTGSTVMAFLEKKV